MSSWPDFYLTMALLVIFALALLPIAGVLYWFDI